MQPVVLLISLILMAVLSLVFWLAVRASDGPEPGPKANSKRSGLIWAMTIVGVIVAVGTLRPWPHAVRYIHSDPRHHPLYTRQIVL
ncbi:hypothetical protein [Ruegeria faecimaris]|uniref:hypothetical protein n=1 Tax=Ruegeria faecimaris TaxID=686389 RepID=UPI00232FAE41|nr:hypothetical protein [Ruegeria faecimaris]